VTRIGLRGGAPDGRKQHSGLLTEGIESFPRTPFGICKLSGRE
jgi:hypothetical protein